jgi:hypothetical protein
VPAWKGETIAIGVAVLWSLNSSFLTRQQKDRLINSELIRLVLLFYSLLTLWTTSGSFCLNADRPPGPGCLCRVVGFVLGDYFLFAPITMFMARYSQLMMHGALLQRFRVHLRGEKCPAFIGRMCLTLTGIAISY